MSLYKKINTIPKIKFNEIISVGSLKVGNYVLYFKLEDADGNETDFIGESGIISVFKGNNKDPFSIDGGIADMLAYKSISITVDNIDTAYDYLKVYVVRTSAT
nr:MAG TPA: stabilization protein [Caudoviricetes sp.]